jgi:hypothetical protein
MNDLKQVQPLVDAAGASPSPRRSECPRKRLLRAAHTRWPRQIQVGMDPDGGIG